MGLEDRAAMTERSAPHVSGSGERLAFDGAGPSGPERDAAWSGALVAATVVIAWVAAFAVARLNEPWFAFLNGYVDARETVARGLLFSSWLALVGGAIVVWRPEAFGFRMGDISRHGPLIVGTCVVAAIVTAVLITVIGGTPYDDASLFIETIVVPVTEELVFRAVLLTVLLGVFARLLRPRPATILAVLVNGLAFGLAHAANATSLASAFVIGQMAFAAGLGTACAALMVRTRSVYPAMLLHGVVNGVVVLL